MTPEELKKFQDLLDRFEKSEKRFNLFLSHDHFMTGGAPLLLKNLPNYGLHQQTINLKTSEAAANDNYDTFFIADFDLEIISAEESHTTAGSDAGAVTLYVFKLTTGQLLADGVSVLSTTFNLKSKKTASAPYCLPSILPRYLDAED